MKTKNNDNYLSVLLSDKSGEIEGKLWQTGSNDYANLTEGEPVFVSGKVEKFKDKLQLNIDIIKEVKKTESDIFQQLIPTTSKDIKRLYSELVSLKNSISNKYLHKLVEKILIKDREFLERFKAAPAASQKHHAYRGGLLEHTVSVANLCKLFSSKYSEINYDILIAGAILHDIGKVEEYDDKTFKRTYSGKLLGHISIGIVIIDRKIASIKNFPSKLEYAIKHLILSHHGELEWGSPVQPLTLEAFLLHFADNIDSKVETFPQAKSGDNGWHYNKSLRREILVENFSEEFELKSNNNEKKQESSNTLFQ